MKRKLYPILAIITLMLSARAWCATGMASIDGTKEDSEIGGTLHFEDTPHGLKITGKVENVPSGNHGFHIHEFGDCGDEAKNAGSHYNPDQKPHGLVMKDGTMKVHPGDMGNVTADEKGTAQVDVTIPNVTLTGGKYPVAGRAVVLHEKVDDFSQPVGNAGGRIACGAIVLTGK